MRASSVAFMGSMKIFGGLLDGDESVYFVSVAVVVVVVVDVDVVAADLAVSLPLDALVLAMVYTRD